MKKILWLCLLAACVEEQNLGNVGSQPPATSSAATGSTRLWAITVPGHGYGVAMDSNGDVIAAGDDGSSDGLITKRAAFDGSERWTVTLTGGVVSGVGVDSDDAVTVTGTCHGTVDFGGATLSCPLNANDGFLAKYSSSGTLEWVRLLGATGVAIVVAPDGRATIGGMFTGTIQLGDQTFMASTLSNAFLASYDWSGTFVWGHAFLDGPLIDTMSLAPNGDVIAAGTLENAASVGGAELVPDGSSRAFVTRFRSDGVYLSSSTVGASDVVDSRANQVAIDAKANVVVQSLESNTGSAMTTRLHVLDSDDADLWQAQIENDDGGSQQNRALVASADGTIASAQWVDNWNTGASYMEVVTYSDAGTPAVARFGSRIPAPPAVGDMGFRTGTTGALGVASFVGDLAGTVDFGNGPVSATSTPGLVVAHFALPEATNPDGEVVDSVEGAP